jgi:hypothetical protein
MFPAKSTSDAIELSKISLPLLRLQIVSSIACVLAELACLVVTFKRRSRRDEGKGVESHISIMNVSGRASFCRMFPFLLVLVFWLLPFDPSLYSTIMDGVRGTTSYPVLGGAGVYAILLDENGSYPSTSLTTSTAGQQPREQFNPATANMSQSVVAHHLHHVRAIFLELARRLQDVLSFISSSIVDIFTGGPSSSSSPSPPRGTSGAKGVDDTPRQHREKDGESSRTAAVSDIPVSWNGHPVTAKERATLEVFHARRQSATDTGDRSGAGVGSSSAGSSSAGAGAVSPWLQTASSTEFLRFLRHKHGSQEEAWKMILTHARWRVSKYGADTIVRDSPYEHSALHREVFWLGLSKSDCPTLVIRTKAHDGADYNEDPRIFTSFIVSVLEQGRAEYGVGVSRPVCMLMDRGPYERNGEPKVDKMDMSVIPNLVKLFQHLYSTVMVSVVSG